MSLELKKKLHELCMEHVDDNIALEKKAMEYVEESAELEAKSSVGDKYETGRAMMHIENDKHKAQIAQYLQQKTILGQIDVSTENDEVLPGSIVVTNECTYFIAVGLGDIEYDGITYCTMSLASPLGKELAHKKAGETFPFRHKSITVKSVI